MINGMTQRIFSTARKVRLAFGIAALGCALALTPVFQGMAHDIHTPEDDDTPITDTRNYDNPNITSFKYEYAFDKMYYPAYPAVVEAMAPVWKGTEADISLKSPNNPPLNLAEYDLNGDGIPEIIASPIEMTEGGDYCGRNLLRCPHYVMDTSTGKMKILGVIKAFAIDRGDEIKNGYWTLKVFMDSNLPENNPQIDVYAYDKKQKTYMKQQPN